MVLIIKAFTQVTSNLQANGNDRHKNKSVN